MVLQPDKLQPAVVLKRSSNVRKWVDTKLANFFFLNEDSVISWLNPKYIPSHSGAVHEL